MIRIFAVSYLHTYNADVVDGSSCPHFGARSSESREDAVRQLLSQIRAAGYSDDWEVVGDEYYRGPRSGST